MLAIKSFESIAKFKYLVIILAIKVAFVKELNSTLKSGKTYGQKSFVFQFFCSKI